ncbi:hypothetical protein ON010_g18604 [Phytophthora cinnamomi]|nr:hypothetical protein ON010_g18604 [Phytophthora cinnamomi]
MTRNEGNNREGKQGAAQDQGAKSTRRTEGAAGEVASDADDSAEASSEAWYGVSPPASELNPGEDRATWEADAQSHQASTSL